MKKEEFISKLRFCLSDLPMEDLDQIIDFYQELIFDGIEQGYTEEEILRRFDAPEEVARQIRAEYGGLVVYTAKGKSKEEKYEYGPKDMIHTVKVQTENLRIHIRTVEDGPVKVYFKPREGQDIVTCKEDNGVFSFEHKSKGSSPLSWLNFFIDYNLLVLELPCSFAGNLWIRTTNASIKGSGMMNLAQAEIISSNGKIKLENSKIERLRIKSNNAKIEIANVAGETLEAASGNGIITARDCRFTEQLTMETQNGAVTGKNLIGDHIVMNTFNGLITACVIGNQQDYNLDCCTMNGFCNIESVRSPERTKDLSARTHNGRIQIDFTM
ncbi:MAG: DUF4097 family beta strand repeat-containing protein [Lachnospiraceae bacterium]|nr:DUF4097 family beta strand repeat-containing protein [Lachnospiraceae bacterium]